MPWAMLGSNKGLFKKKIKRGLTSGFKKATFYTYWGYQFYIVA
jgi:hypothetical protein